MRTTGWAAIALLTLASVGCAAKSDWTDTLTLVNVTGRWEGTFLASGFNRQGPTRQIRLTLKQNGSKVKGQGVLSSLERSVDGGIDGEVFSGQIGDMRFQLTVNGNEMTGTAEGLSEGLMLCPCRLELHRVGSE